MRLEKDYEDFIKLLNRNRVKYCIVGAFAMALHSSPRYTKDIDILVQPDLTNGENIIKALEEFGFKDLDLSASDFSVPGKIIQLGYEPIRIDLITSIDGCSFEKIWENKEKGTYGKTDVFFIGLDELIKNKKSTNRAQDKADLEILLLAKKEKDKSSSH
ncbi:nucleotidyl transferase AbiEii/AbiGii toxin family protein [bacterium]|nr:nucleotidyl transferase AbiEii/AbiGii toxin family protein [bacterium]